MDHHKTEWHRGNLNLFAEKKPSISYELFLQEKAKDDPTLLKLVNDMDGQYWTIFYKLHKVDLSSLFATYVYTNYLINTDTYIKLLDIGCGNLRDSIYFLSKGITVTGIDKYFSSENSDVNYIQDDAKLVLLKQQIKTVQDVIYMRFFLHSVSYEDGESILSLAISNLKPGGLLCIEVRALDDTNIPISSRQKDGAYVTDHSRWLYTVDRLKSVLKNMELLECKQDKGFSPLGKDNPVLIRVIAKKPFSPLYETSTNYPLYKQVVSKQIDYVKSSYLDLIKFNKLVEQNKFKYTAVGGTLLGLHRHGGVIPWDGDIDIGLLKEDFTKLMNQKTNMFKVRINTKNARYHLGTLDIFLLEDKGEWYEGENNTLCHKNEYTTIVKHSFGKTYIYAPTDSSKTLEKKYGPDFYSMGCVKGQPLFTLTQEDHVCL